VADREGLADPGAGAREPAVTGARPLMFLTRHRPAAAVRSGSPHRV
jgi:hypothetical protein